MARADGIALLDVGPRIGRELLDAERHLAVLAVERQDDRFHLVADFHELLSRTQMLAPRHFRDMDQTLDARCDLDERAVVGHHDDAALDLVAYLQVRVERIPRVRGELLQTQRDTFFRIVEVEDHDVQLFVQMNDFLGMVHAAPTQVGDMDQAVHAAQIDEHAVGGDVLDGTLENLALFELRHDLLLLRLELGLDQRLVRHDDVAELLIDLHDLELHRLVDIDVVVADRLHVDLRAGQECLDAEHVDDHAALGAALDVAFDYLVLLERLVHTIPRAELAGFLVREHELPLLVLGAFDVYFDLLAYGQFGVISEFADRNDAFRLVADVDHYFALGEPDYGSLDHFADLNVRQRLVVLGCDFLLRFAVQVRIVLVGFPVERVEVDGSGRHRLGGFHFRLVFVVCRHVVCFGN